MSSDTDEPSLKEKILLEEKTKLENDFGIQRAKFMDIFKQKEDELLDCHKKLELCEKQIEDLKSEIAIATLNRDDDLAALQRKFQEEIATHRLIMKESISQAYQNSEEKFETERAGWLKNNEQMERELYDLRLKINNEKENSLVSLAKTIQRKVRKDDQENLEISMKKAQEGAEMMKSLVEPLEKEVIMLNQLLKEKNDQLQDLKSKDISPSSSPPHNENKVKELNDNLRTEKSSRTDLELYVGVLNKQKDVLQADNDRLRIELRNTFAKLNYEKKRWAEASKSWDIITNQLSSQQFDNNLIEPFNIMFKPIANGDNYKESITVSVSEDVFDENRTDNLQIAETSKKLDSLDVLVPNSPDTIHIPSVSEIIYTSKNDSSSLLTDEQEKSLNEFNLEIKASDELFSETQHLISSISNDYRKGIMIESDLKTLQNKLLAKNRCIQCKDIEEKQKETEHRIQTEIATCQRMLAAERQAVVRLNEYTGELEANIRTLTQLNEEQLSSVCNKLTECYQFIHSVKAYFVKMRDKLFDHLECMTSDRQDIQKRKKYRLRLCVDTAALRSWIVH